MVTLSLYTQYKCVYRCQFIYKGIRQQNIVLNCPSIYTAWLSHLAICFRSPVYLFTIEEFSRIPNSAWQTQHFILFFVKYSVNTKTLHTQPLRNSSGVARSLLEIMYFCTNFIWSGLQTYGVFRSFLGVHMITLTCSLVSEF